MEHHAGGCATTEMNIERGEMTAETETLTEFARYLAKPGGPTGFLLAVPVNWTASVGGHRP
jgi:hypothetical protein